MDWAPDGSLFVGHSKHSWAGSQGIQQVQWSGETPFEVQNVNLTKTGFRFTFAQPVDRKIAAKKETWPFLRYYFQYTQSYGSPQTDETAVEVDSVKISEDGTVVDVNLKELKAWHIHEVNIEGLKSEKGEDLSNRLVVYTLNRLLENTPPEPLQLGEEKRKSTSKPSQPVPVKELRGIAYEAESAQLDGPAKSSQHGGFSGTGYIDFGEGEESVQWTIETETKGENEILIRYALGGGSERPLQLSVNKKEIKTLSFPATGGWSDWKDLIIPVTLNIGENTISLKTTGKSGGNIDHLQLIE